MSRSVHSLQRIRWILLVFSLVFCLFWDHSFHEVNGRSIISTFSRNSDLYDKLGVSRRATKSEIKKAFRALTMQHHPDLKETAEEKEEAKKKMMEILRAYEILSDSERRAVYDDEGTVDSPQGVPDPSSFTTAEELFNFFHQSPPLVSRTPTLESAKELDRMFSFRGRKIFLVHVYTDDNQECRSFAPSWEFLYQSHLVRSGIVEMYRIDAYSTEGSKLLKKLRITVRSNSPPPVFAIVDGERWNYNVEMKSYTKIRIDLEDFLFKFFYEAYAESFHQIDSTEELIEWLEQPLPASKKGRVMLPLSDEQESLSHVLQIRYPSLEVRMARRSALVELAESYCGQTIKAVDRFGDPVPVPDMAVAVHGLLTRQERSHTSTSAKSGKKKLSAAPVRVEAALNCQNVTIAVSSHFSYEKVSNFVDEVFAEKNQKGSTSSFLPLDAVRFFEVCRSHCLIYVRPACSVGSVEDESAFKLLRRPYSSVKTGTLCLDEHPGLLQKIQAAAEAVPGQKINIMLPFLVALIDSDDTHLYPILTSQEEQSPSRLLASDVDAALAQLLLQRDAGVSSDADLPPFTLKIPSGGVSGVMETEAFPMSSTQRYAIMSARFYQMIQPYFATTMPFFFMYLFHVFYLNRNKNPVKPVNKTGRSMGAVFDEDDLDAAKVGKGFLILVVDKRPPASGPLTLPSIAADARFTVRVLNTAHRRWKKWIEKNQPRSNDIEGEDTLSEEEIMILAIRQTKMAGAIKPAHQSVDSFLRDLLDGTVVPKLSVPYSSLN